METDQKYATPNAADWARDVEGGMSDQEIRARALECASRRYANVSYDDFWQYVAEFEDYIRNGK